MGWKCDTVLIHPAGAEEKPEIFLRDLGFHISAIGEKPFDRVMWPDEDTIWVGRVADCLLISSQRLTQPFFEDARSGLEFALFRRFPNAEIAAVLLFSVVDLWGFALYRNGALLRRKAGSAEDGTFLDEGAPLAEEEELLARSRLDPDGRRLYRLPDLRDEEVSEESVGEEFVFRIFERVTGARPDIAPKDGIDLLETPCAGFILRPWWKFW